MILSTAYGIAVKESDDPYVSTAEIALNGLAEAGIPGRFWVDFFPLLKHVPSWMPGAGFKRKAAYWAKINEEMCEKPYLYVKDQLVSWTTIEFPRFRTDLEFSKAKGTATPSVAATLIESLPDESDPRRAEEDTIAKNVAAVAYAGMFF